eukprot:314835_1
MDLDPFDKRYANVPLDVPISHVEDYVKRKNNRNDQDHLQTQIMYFKKEFGNLPTRGKAATNDDDNNNNNNTTMSTQTQIQNNDDHKDENNNDDNTENNRTETTLNIHNDDIILPSYDSISSIRSALARYEAWQYNNNNNNN